MDLLDEPFGEWAERTYVRVPECTCDDLPVPRHLLGAPVPRSTLPSQVLGRVALEVLCRVLRQGVPGRSTEVPQPAAGPDERLLAEAALLEGLAAEYEAAGAVLSAADARSRAVQHRAAAVSGASGSEARSLMVPVSDELLARVGGEVAPPADPECAACADVLPGGMVVAAPDGSSFTLTLGTCTGALRLGPIVMPTVASALRAHRGR